MLMLEDFLDVPSFDDLGEAVDLNDVADNYEEYAEFLD